MQIYLALLNKIRLLIIFFLILTITNNSLLALQIRVIAQVGNAVITDEDLKKEIFVLEYIFNNNINKNQIKRIALENLIEINVKDLEIKKKKIEISDNEVWHFLNSLFKNYNKSLEDYRKVINNDKVYEKYLFEKIKIEISWNRLILLKFSNNLDVNMDEILAKNNEKKPENFDKIISQEKNKKLKVLSESYFNEVKNKILIKYL